KMELLAALVHRPQVLFLDEPTIGLDVVAKARVRTFLADVNRLRGTTILITSHDMDDIEALCSRVMIVNHGRIAYDGGLADLVQGVQPRKLIRATYGAAIDLRVAKDLLVWTSDLEGHDTREFSTSLEMTKVEGDDESGQVLSLEVTRDRMSDVLEVLPRLGPLIDLTVADADVEEIIRGLFAADIGAEAIATGAGVTP
ncbi:MAG TPA: hypothetical protein VNZ55_13350, partial [Thermomicrobiales bacterium]|nr:hypothetical protein [Thermomicrobiales bacterium]